MVFIGPVGTSNLEVNVQKTVMRWKGGPFSKEDVFRYGGKKIKLVNQFKFDYLEVTLQTKFGFTKHVRRLKRNTSTATAMLTRHLSKLTTDSVLKILNVKIKPILLAIVAYIGDS